MDSFLNEIGVRIAEQRKKFGISQTEFAEKLGKSLRTIQKYESGEIDMPLSMLKEISKVLSVPMNYLIGYDSSHIKLETLADVYTFIFELDRKKELSFDISVDKSDSDEWKCSLVFDGKSKTADLNSDFCLAMETFCNNREALNTYWMDYQTYDDWEDKTIERHTELFLQNKEREALDSTTIIQRRNELERQKLEKMLAEKQVNEGVDCP